MERTWEVVGRNDWELPLGTTIGDALRKLVRRRFKHNTAKTLETLWGLDPKTAKNVVQSGHVSERTLTKAAKSERWALWIALGEEIFEETYAQYLARLADDRERAAREAREAEADHADLAARAAISFALLDGRPDARGRAGVKQARPTPDGSRTPADAQARLTDSRRP
jgi:hypothetical protein